MISVVEPECLQVADKTERPRLAACDGSKQGQQIGTDHISCFAVTRETGLQSNLSIKEDNYKVKIVTAI